MWESQEIIIDIIEIIQVSDNNGGLDQCRNREGGEKWVLNIL